MSDYTGVTNRLGNTIALPFTSFATGEPAMLDLAYSADDLTRQNDMFWLDGIRRDSNDWANGDGAVRWINGFNVAVRPFRAHVNGTIVYADQIVLAVAPETVSTRVDSVIIRRDYQSRRADVMLLKGKSGSSAAPALKYNNFGVAEFELARIKVSSSMVSLSQSDITDMRRVLTADFGVRPVVADKGKNIIVDEIGGLKLRFPGVFPGKIDLLPIRPARLAADAPGWYFCNGDKYQLTSAVGKALQSLHGNLKTDFGITVSGSTISIPNMFHSDGRGYFLRAVNGSSRQPGNVEGDAIRNITGNINNIGGGHNVKPSASGVFKTSAWLMGQNFVTTVNSEGNIVTAYFNASTVVPTASENRSLNRGMTPAIFLGV